jgi:hypothetical protein
MADIRYAIPKCVASCVYSKIVTQHIPNIMLALHDKVRTYILNHRTCVQLVNFLLKELGELLSSAQAL